MQPIAQNVAGQIFEEKSKIESQISNIESLSESEKILLSAQNVGNYLRNH